MHSKRLFEAMQVSRVLVVPRQLLNDIIGLGPWVLLCVANGSQRDTYGMYPNTKIIEYASPGNRRLLLGVGSMADYNNMYIQEPPLATAEHR